MKNKISLALYFIVLILLVIFIILFAKNNAVPVTINIMSGTFISQLWIVIMSSFFIGVFITLSLSLYSILRLKFKLSKLSKLHINETEQTENLFTGTNSFVSNNEED